MKRILIILLLCVGSFIHAQEYQLSELEDIAYTFFNRDTLHVVNKDSVCLTKQIASIEAIQRDSIDFLQTRKLPVKK